MSQYDLNFEEDLFHEDHAVAFAVWLGQHYPDALYKYGSDEDNGEQAFKDLYEQFKKDNE